MTDRGATIAAYRCGACGRPIPTRRMHVGAGRIICCYPCTELATTHAVAFPDCDGQDHDATHDVFDHRLAWAPTAADVATVRSLNAERRSA